MPSLVGSEMCIRDSHLVEEYPRSSLSASYSSRSGSHLSTIAKPTRRQDAQSYTSSSSSHPVTTASMINQLPKSPRSPAVRLPGIPACLPLLPQQYPLENVVTRATQASSPGNSYNGNSYNSSNICSTYNNCRLLTSPLSPPVSPVFFHNPGSATCRPVSYTHLTLPTICSV